jgi:hypothetical protein
MRDMIVIDCGQAGIARFKKGVAQRFEVGDGFVYVSGKIKLADETLFDAILEIDTSSSCEHWGTMIFMDKGPPAVQGEPEFLKILGRSKDEVFPYTYRPDPEMLPEDDIHTGDDGWSG